MTNQQFLSLAYTSQDSDGQNFINIIAKRTYTIYPDFPCQVSPEQLPIFFAPEYYEDGENKQVIDTAPKVDPDVLCHLKTGTDLVIQGQAYSLAGPVQQMQVSVEIQTSQQHGKVKKTSCKLDVVGNRRAEYRGKGNPVRFTPPEEFISMPILYSSAYGGRDIWAEKAHPDKPMEWLAKYSESSAEDLSRYSYPRNPSGKGYLIFPEKEAVENLELPNIEIPDDRVTPERICRGSIFNWPSAPIPGGFDWLEQTWFPRIAFIGGCTEYEGKPTDFHEVRTGYLPEDFIAGNGLRALPMERISNRFFNGASPHLVLSELKGDEVINLFGMHSRYKRLSIHLPKEKPFMLVELPTNAKPFELSSALRTVCIQPDKDQLTTVWAGRHPIDIPLTEPQAERIRHAVQWKPLGRKL